MFWSVGIRSRTSSSAGSGSGAREQGLDEVLFQGRAVDGLLRDLAQGDDGVLVVVAVDGQLLPAAEVARALGGEQDELEPVGNLLDAVFDSHARHRRAPRQSVKPLIKPGHAAPQGHHAGKDVDSGPVQLRQRLRRGRSRRGRPVRRDVAQRGEHEGAFGQARVRQDQVGRIDAEVVDREQVEVERAGGVGRGADAAGLGLDGVQQGEQGGRVGAVRRAGDAVDVVGLVRTAGRVRCGTSGSRRTRRGRRGPPPGATARRQVASGGRPSASGRLAPTATRIVRCSISLSAPRVSG